MNVTAWIIVGILKSGGIHHDTDVAFTTEAQCQAIVKQSQPGLGDYMKLSCVEVYVNATPATVKQK